MARALWHPFANMAELVDELVVIGGNGSYVVDDRGREYLDATASLWYCNIGYGREEIATAVERQLKQLPAYSTFGVYANRPALELAEWIATLAPMVDAKVFFTLGGSDAVESAAKLVRRYWSAVGRPTKRIIITREFAYHGMHAYGTSLGGISLNTEGLGPLVPDVVHVAHGSADALRSAIEKTGAENIAAFMGEPVIGAGGVIPPHENYWHEITSICREFDVLLVSDEVITGWGRLGRWFGCERFEFEPDIVVFAKGITSGYLPLGGVIVGSRVQEPFWSGEGVWFRHGYTYSGHATCCAAALANLAVLSGEGLVERVGGFEEIFASEVRNLGSHDLVSEVRTCGLLAGVELDADALREHPGLIEAVVELARDEGAITRALRGCTLQISPAFTIQQDEVAAIVAALHRALDRASSA